MPGSLKEVAAATLHASGCCSKAQYAMLTVTTQEEHSLTVGNLAAAALADTWTKLCLEKADQVIL